MIVDSVCRLCSSCCPIEAEVRDNRLVRAWRRSFLDPDRRLPCAKLAAAPEIVYSPLRLTRPLVRDSRNAEFREAGWDEALDRVAGLMRQHRERSGARSVAWLRGMAADWGAPWDYPNRLMHGFGSPNTIGNGSICFVGREFAHTYTYGSMAFPEAKNAKLIIVWGKNDGNTALGAAEAIHWAKEHGARLVVIDPVRTQLADKADLWLPIRPGHDGLLAMAMIHEIISGDLFDGDFVADHTVGFDRLKEVAARYPAEQVAAELWLAPEQIRDLARSYATVKPASIIDGNGLDMHREMFDTTRAIAMLRALTGNLDKPGGDVLPQPVPVRNIQLRERLPAEAEPVTRDFSLFNTFSETWGNQMQGCLVDAMLDHRPYPVEMVIVQSGNPVVTMADTTRTRKAFAAVEHLVVIDLFMNETARMADIVLPALADRVRTGPAPGTHGGVPLAHGRGGDRLSTRTRRGHGGRPAPERQGTAPGGDPLREVPRPAPAHALGQGGVFLGAAGRGRFQRRTLCGRPGAEPDQLQRPGGRVPARRHQRQPRHPLHQLPVPPDPGPGPGQQRPGGGYPSRGSRTLPDRRGRAGAHRNPKGDGGNDRAHQRGDPPGHDPARLGLGRRGPGG
jgi:predicted molibdopterin-dependent oxidoreductase YjgC